MKNKIYTCSLMVNLIPGADNTLVLSLNNERRKCSLKNVIYDLDLQIAVTGEKIPLEQNTSIDHELFIRPNVTENPLLTSIFDNPSGSAVFVSTGNLIQLYKSKQYFFKNLEYQQIIDVVWYVKNFDLLETIDCFAHLTFEIDEE